MKVGGIAIIGYFTVLFGMIIMDLLIYKPMTYVPLDAFFDTAIPIWGLLGIFTLIMVLTLAMVFNK